MCLFVVLFVLFVVRSPLRGSECGVVRFGTDGFYLCGDRGHWPQHFDEICHLVSKRRKRPRGARDRGGFQELSVSRGAFDTRFVFFGAKGRDLDPVGNRLAPKSDVAKGILTRLFSLLGEPVTESRKIQMRNEN